MISIIICSRTETISNALYNNLKETIGYAYELIVVDNSKNKYSIFQAYNIGISKSVGDYLCFIHDDIFVHTSGWGTIINKIFSNHKKIGLLGVAGTRVKTKMPSAWWRCQLEDRHVKIIQHSKSVAKEIFNLGFKNTLEQVVVIDGVFMVARKVNGIFFNEKIEGFHNYDLNLSFEYLSHNYQVFVTDEILIEHFSSGNMNNDWLESTYKVHDLYKDFLPLSVNKRKMNTTLEISNAKRFVRDCLKLGEKRLAFLTWVKLFRISPFLKYHFKFWILLISKN